MPKSLPIYLGNGHFILQIKENLVLTKSRIFEDNYGNS